MRFPVEHFLILLILGKIESTATPNSLKIVKKNDKLNSNKISFTS